MKLRRTLAVAVAATVTTPITLLAATPAFADAKPTAQTEDRSTYAELQKDAADARKAYEEAVAAEKKAQQEVEDTQSDTYPLRVAKIEADKAAQTAATAKADAEKAVADAEAELEAAETEAEKAEAQTALTEAEATLDEATKAKKKADAEAEAANTALEDAEVAALHKLHLARKALTAATKKKEAADKALAAAGECVREPGLTVLAHGLPSKVVGGSTVPFTVRVTNGTDRTLDVDPLVFFHEYDKKNDSLTVQWFDGSTWKTHDSDKKVYLNRIEDMEPGSHSVVKMRMEIGSDAGKAAALALFAGDASDVYNPCVLGPMKRYDFQILPAGSEPGDVDDAKPGKPDADDVDKRPDAGEPGSGTGKKTGADSETGTSPQGGTSDEATTGGELATTGASSAPGQLALASAAAVALGAGAVFVARRRKAGQN